MTKNIDEIALRTCLDRGSVSFGSIYSSSKEKKRSKLFTLYGNRVAVHLAFYQARWAEMERKKRALIKVIRLLEERRHDGNSGMVWS